MGHMKIPSNGLSLCIPLAWPPTPTNWKWHPPRYNEQVQPCSQHEELYVMGSNSRGRIRRARWATETSHNSREGFKIKKGEWRNFKCNHSCYIRPQWNKATVNKATMKLVRLLPDFSLRIFVTRSTCVHKNQFDTYE